MAEHSTAYLRSSSDSEVNERSSKQSDLEHERTKRYSGSQLPYSKIPANVESSANYNNPNKSLVDYEIFDDAISSLENITHRTMNVGRNVPEAFESYHKANIDTDIQVIQQQLYNEENGDEKEIVAPENSSLRSTTAEMASDDNRPKVHDIFKTPMSIDCLRQEILASLPEEESSIRNKQSSENEVHVANSIMYPILEVPPKENFLVPSEDFIGEPRCLALKKYATDDDMDDALELNFAEFDDEDESINEQPPKSKSSTKNAQRKNSNDMFLDDDDPVDGENSKNKNYIDLANPKNNWERPVVEKEEGELTPDLYSTTLSDGGESKTRSNKHSIQTTKESNQATRDKQPEQRKESNQDFFLKINRCFRQLEREFCNMHVPRGSRRMIGQLQNTLCNVDRMKRRLAFLIDSAKNVTSDKPKSASSNSKDDKHSSSRRGSFDDGKSRSSKTESGRAERSTSLLLRDTIRSQKEAEARMNRHIRRTAASIAYAGTKQEKQRIQSLYKRQMNLINQHVIQKNDSGKNQNLKGGGSRAKKESEKAPDGPKVPELKTLDEMEAFLAVLKVQKSQKEEILAKENQKKQQGPLRFTTKKGQPLLEKRPQPVLLVSANPPQDQVVDVGEETEWEKQIEVLKAMSDKRKQILKNKKDYEEVRLLQEQLQQLTNMDVPAEAGEISVNSKTNLKNPKRPKEHNVSKSVTKEGKETSAKEIELKKGDETSLKSDSISVKKDQKERECMKPTFHPRCSDCEVESQEIIPENSKRRKKRKFVEEENSSSETSKSDKEVKNKILQKRKRTESGGKLSAHKKYSESERRSLRSRHRSNTEEATIIDGFDEKLPEELMSKKLLIVGDKNMELLNERFCLKVKGNQIYLKKVGRAKRAGKVQREQRRESNQSEWKIRSGGKRSRTIDEKAETKHSLKEMEDFLQQLRAKKKVLSEERDYIPKSNQQSREMKFMARIQAKRKAKLMACVSTATSDITEKEAKFLKDLENQARDPCDSPDTEKRKQKLMQKIREETDAIVLQQKQQVEDDPLSDVKTFLNMIKEAESGNDEKSKQICVSFSMKRSEVKQLESITSGKASALTEESQKFLNSLRAKMRAKKTTVVEGGDHHGQKG